MSLPLMPKATAVWLVDNTSLTFNQIADFCGMIVLEVQAIADGSSSSSLMAVDPVLNGQLTKEEIERCEKDPKAKLQLVEKEEPVAKAPKGKTEDKWDAVAWLLKNHPAMTDAHIRKLVHTTVCVVNSIRNKTHPKMSSIKERNPVKLGLCTDAELKKIAKEARIDEVRTIPVEQGEI